MNYTPISTFTPTTPDPVAECLALFPGRRTNWAAETRAEVKRAIAMHEAAIINLQEAVRQDDNYLSVSACMFLPLAQESSDMASALIRGAMGYARNLAVPDYSRECGK